MDFFVKNPEKVVFFFKKSRFFSDKVDIFKANC
jgi:hypothetical protein